MCLSSTASLDSLIRSRKARLLKGRPFESSDCWIAIRMIQWYYQKLRCASGSSLAAALHFCALSPVPEAISRPEEAPIGNRVRKIETIKETTTVYQTKNWTCPGKVVQVQFSGLRRAAAERAFCTESDANFKISREWQTPATLKLPILSLRKLATTSVLKWNAEENSPQRSCVLPSICNLSQSLSQSQM